jgi:hypothetical protein
VSFVIKEIEKGRKIHNLLVLQVDLKHLCKVTLDLCKNVQKSYFHFMSFMIEEIDNVIAIDY